MTSKYLGNLCKTIPYKAPTSATVITYSMRQNADSMQIDRLTIYDKNEMPNVSDDFIKYLLKNRDNLK